MFALPFLRITLKSTVFFFKVLLKKNENQGALEK